MPVIVLPVLSGRDGSGRGLMGVRTMNPVTHFLTGWVIANVDDLGRRDRGIVTLAAIIPEMLFFLFCHSIPHYNW
jgi:hypothetical protein